MIAGIVGTILKALNRPGFLNIYYSVKPVIPRGLQLAVRRHVARAKLPMCSDHWPIDWQCSAAPDGWKGWPDGKKFAMVITHDVDTPRGYAKCRALAELEMEMGFRSSFNFVAEAYRVEPQIRNYLDQNGFEVGLHGLRHDGKLYRSREIFEHNASLINMYMKEWNCVGFRSPSMHCMIDWMHKLNIEYDASTFDTDPFEPSPSGTRRIFPFIVKTQGNSKGFVELPYTLPQDFTLFIILRYKGIDVWKKKLDWLAEQGGMALVNVHPDYMTFNGAPCGREEYSAELYRNFLKYVSSAYKDRYWHALPREMARYWVLNAARSNKMMRA